jgi:phage FluMu protein Com
MPEKEIVISLAELDRLEVICPRCKAGVTFTSTEDSRFPAKCSACGETLAIGISNIGDAWKNFLSQAKAATIQFRLKA